MVIFKSTPTKKNNVIIPVSFKEVVNLLLQNKEKILSDTKMKNVRLSYEYFISISLIGYSELPVGTLIELWSNISGWVRECPHCGSNVYFQGFGGSINSNRGSGWGCCINCNSNIRVRFDGYSAFTGLKLAKKYKEEYKAHLDSRYGLIELSSKKSNISEQMNISELIDILRSADNGI